MKCISGFVGRVLGVVRSFFKLFDLTYEDEIVGDVDDEIEHIEVRRNEMTNVSNEQQLAYESAIIGAAINIIRADGFTKVGKLRAPVRKSLTSIFSIEEYKDFVWKLRVQAWGDGVPDVELSECEVEFGRQIQTFRKSTLTKTGKIKKSTPDRVEALFSIENDDEFEVALTKIVNKFGG